MSDTYSYTLTKNDEGNFVLRSTVKSFNLDHVTDKDVVAFYTHFSEYASFDTGLLPLDGTGVLAIRTAGPHTQIVTQHAPGLYHVNWGSYEGDRSASAYYLAQPYRIVIGDFENGNLLGARMFYSPYPITSPDNPLYHVNLPNINCKGYRGNGVGWICLYHKDDWSNLPFNEKVNRFIERCSGVETYNDQNMSETDGPRFYQSAGKPSYFYNPSEWQFKSQQEGFHWTLNPDLLIPVLVQDMDNQDKHYPEGQQLTLAMAMLGNYQAYYTDKNIPKMYNVVSRNDLNFKDSNIADFVKRAFASAPVTYQHKPKDDPYSFTTLHREKNGSAQLKLPITSSDDDEDDENNWTCWSCEDSFTESDSSYTIYNDEEVCEGCFNEYYVYIPSADAHFNYDDSSVVYVENENEHFHIDYDTVYYCPDCSTSFAASGKSEAAIKKVYSQLHPTQNEDEYICTPCFNSMITDEELSTTFCMSCKTTVITSTGWEHVFPTIKALINYEDDKLVPGSLTLCNNCSPIHAVCACGYLVSPDFISSQCTPTSIETGNDSVQLTVNKCCTDCLGPVYFEGDEAKANYVSKNPESLVSLLNVKYYNNATGVTVSFKDDETF